MASGEMFLGGFASGFLAKGFHIGYGLYFTTNRVIGIDLGSGGRWSTRRHHGRIH
jgi:hypothetical protein